MYMCMYIMKSIKIGKFYVDDDSFAEQQLSCRNHVSSDRRQVECSGTVLVSRVDVTALRQEADDFDELLPFSKPNNVDVTA